MLKRATILGVGLSVVASCALFSQQEEPDIDRGMVLLEGLDVTDAQKADEIRAAERRLGIIDGQFVPNERYPNADFGPASIVIKALASESFDKEYIPALFDDQSGDDRCSEARNEKIRFHQQNGVVPASFGKILEPMGLKNYEGDLWAGTLDVCTWIREGNSYDEYFFQMRFLPNKEGTVRTFVNQGGSNPFPDTLDLTEVDDPSEILKMMQTFKYKLHGSNDAVEIVAAYRNGLLLPPSDKIYEQGGSCFDFFLTDDDALQSMQAGVLPDQLSYCMGRCNAVILNTY